MSSELTVGHFAAFFEEVHHHKPFPWQDRLVRQVVETGKWPLVLDLPTGSGKTAALDIAVFHLAVEAGRRLDRRAPVRIIFIVDRRLVVDDAFERARKVADALASAKSGPVSHLVAESLRQLAGDAAPPLIARELRGGIPLETDWARSPSQPTILCSTVDQAGSRLLFRGYGVSNSMKPVHAGLLGADCLLLLDEAHLSEPFRQTLDWVERYNGEQWRETETGSPWSFTTLTATPGEKSTKSTFGLEADDLQHPVLQRRLKAPKLARLIELSKAGGRKKDEAQEEQQGEEEDTGQLPEKARVNRIIDELINMLRELRKKIDNPAIGIVVNRVARARALFEELRKHSIFPEIDAILMIGPARPAERDELVKKLEPIQTSKKIRCKEEPLVIVSTQCIEVGVDLDLDGLITEVAPLDALRQRFGRLNRDGRPITPQASILGGKADKDDPIYGEATYATWEYLWQNPDFPKSKNPAAPSKVDFGIQAFDERLTKEAEKPTALLSPKSNAPVLMPAHLDLLSQTSPIPVADPEVSLYLHGPNRAADSVTVIWRADITPDSDPIRLRRLLQRMRPRSREAIELPVWAVRSWLRQENAVLSTLADAAGEAPQDKAYAESSRKKVFRWTGDDEDSRWIDPGELRPGSTIIVPAGYGGVDEFGWNPASDYPAMDVADKAAAPYAKRYLAVRVAPEWFMSESAKTKAAEAIATIGSRRWKDLRDALVSLVAAETKELESRRSLAKDSDKAVLQQRQTLMQQTEAALGKLDRAKRGKVQIETDPYQDEEGVPQGAIFLAPFGIEPDEHQEWHASDVDDTPNTTEDDLLGSLWNAPSGQLLREHSGQVEEKVRQFAERAGLSAARVADLTVAAYLHDAGKVDPRFQRWLAYDDPLGPDPKQEAQVLAKSMRPLPPAARKVAGLPDKWRHEAFSVRLAPEAIRFQEAKDPDLVLWLIGTHHGYGRPFFPHTDPCDREHRSELSTVLKTPPELLPGPGPQSLSFDWHGFDWAGIYERLKARYGVWELARMEAFLRLADHLASEEAEQKKKASKQ